MRRMTRITTLALTLLLTFSCDDDPTGPGVEPEIVNNPDNFEFQVSDVAGYTGTLVYEWSNSGTAASVDHSASISDGSTTLVIRDDDGTQVYSGNLADDGTFATSSGAAGTWQIRVIFNDTRGTINFRVQTLPSSAIAGLDAGTR